MRLIDTDTIYRQDAVEALKNAEPLVRDFGYYKAIEAIRLLSSAQSERAIKDCRNCKYGNYNDHWNIYFCYHSGNCNDWDKWEPSADLERKKEKIDEIYN